MNEQEIHLIDKYCNSSSLLVITSTGNLIRVQCPFTVEVIKGIEAYSVGDHLTVMQVKMDKNLTSRGILMNNIILLVD